MLRKFIYITCLFLAVATVAKSQENEIIGNELISMNIDSLIADSIKKEYIRTHIPLTVQEKSSIVLDTGSLLYGKYLTHYMKVAPWYATFEKSSRVYVSRRTHTSKEWIFYLFVTLLFFFGFIHSLDRDYIKNIFRVYFNEGFIFRQTKEQLQHSGVTSFFLNFLFVFSAAVFFFFATGNSDIAKGWERWYILGMSSIAVIFLYLVKFIFLSFMGWLFDAKEAFEGYIFIVFLNAKIAGIILLGASMLIAVSEHSSVSLLFQWVGFILMCMVIYRSFKGYTFFSRVVNMPAYVIACFALEILPIAMLFKFLSESYELLIQGIM